MTTIEDKIKLFSNNVYDRIKEEKQKEFDKFEEEKNKTIEKLKIQLEEKRKVALNEAMKRAELKANGIISAEKIKSQQILLEAKNKFVGETLAEIKNRLVSFTKSEAYSDFLIGEVKSTVTKLDDGDYILFLKHDDIAKYQNRVLKEIEKVERVNIVIKETGDEIIGGLLVQSVLGKFRINNSLAARIDDVKAKVGLMLTERLGEEVLQR